MASTRLLLGHRFVPTQSHSRHVYIRFLKAQTTQLETPIIQMGRDLKTAWLEIKTIASVLTAVGWSRLCRNFPQLVWEGRVLFCKHRLIVRLEVTFWAEIYIEPFKTVKSLTNACTKHDVEIKRTNAFHKIIWSQPEMTLKLVEKESNNVSGQAFYFSLVALIQNSNWPLSFSFRNAS